MPKTRKPRVEVTSERFSLAKEAQNKGMTTSQIARLTNLSKVTIGRIMAVDDFISYKESQRTYHSQHQAKKVKASYRYKTVTQDEFDRIKSMFRLVPDIKVSEVAKLFKRADSTIASIKMHDSLEDYKDYHQQRIAKQIKQPEAQPANVLTIEQKLDKVLDLLVEIHDSLNKPLAVVKAENKIAPEVAEAMKRRKWFNR